MRLDFCLRITIDGTELDATLAALLDALQTHGSLAAAARGVGCSYRHAWERLRTAQKEFGQPLVRLERGRGAALSEFGRHLVAAQSRARDEAQAMLARIARDAEARIGSRPAALPGVAIAASHDLGLIELKQYCALAAPAVTLDVRFRGSLDALVELARRRCDLAGFHVGPDARADASLRRHLALRQHRLIVLAERRQGLMVAAGNPRKIRGLADLARRGIRFVNRQPGSGTRMLFDRLLAQTGAASGDIRGYDIEEFTHLAVAATVASGHADAGFGIEAAAASYGLRFIPMARENYYLAGHRARLEQSAVRLLIEHMQSPAWRKRLARLPGYDGARCGTIVEADEALRASRDAP